MTSSEKLCLELNDFQEIITASFHNLWEDLDFSDVTLVCEDDQQVEAHKVILSACSPFFNSVLRRNKHSHPMIYMRGMKSEDLTAIVDFIYHGKTTVYQNDLENFLALAEELQLKGLNRPEDIILEEKVENILVPKSKKQLVKKEMKLSPKLLENNITSTTKSYPVTPEQEKLIIPYQNEEIQKTIYSMIQILPDGDLKWMCTMCGKLMKTKRDLERHIESHIDGLNYPCNQCGKVSRSSHVLINHVSRSHRK